MDIRVVGGNTIEIEGNIKSLEDYGLIKDASAKVVSEGHTEVVFDILDSMSMVSSVIGHILKMINQNKIKVRVNVWDERLYGLLDQLALVQAFHVTKK